MKTIKSGSISLTIRAMKPGEHFDFPLGDHKTIPVSAGAKQIGATVITRTQGEGCEKLKAGHARVWLVSKPTEEGRTTDLFPIGHGIKIPKGASRGRPAGVANAPKGKTKAKAKTSKAKKAPAKVAKTPAKPAKAAVKTKAKAGKGAKLTYASTE